MAAKSHLSDSEELIWLRSRVSELERQSFERSRLTNTLEESRQIFDAFLSNTPAIAWMKDELGRYVFANRRFQELLGEERSTCIGSTDQDLWPDGVADRIRAADILALQTTEVSDSVESLPSRCGDRRFRIHRFPFHASSGRLYVGGIGVDVTGEESARAEATSAMGSLRKEEARSHQLFQSDLIGVMECSGDLITEANDALLGWLGYTRTEAAGLKLNWRDLTPDRYRLRDDEALMELRSSGSWKPYEKEFLSRDGKPLPFIVGGVGTGSTDSFICFLLDISERKQMESRLLRSQKLESLGLIAGGVAHDFNNLLATIMGNASLCLDAVSREHPAFHPLSEVVVASRRASDLTQQVLAYSGRASFALKSVDLSMAVREIGSLLETTISKKIELTFDLAAGLPDIDGDEGQLQQVIMNLVINASDAIGEQPGEIVVRTREQKDGNGRSVLFEVRDTGCGMDEAIRARIFDPFFTTKSGGRGLGLAAVLGIVRNHGGTLLVDSQPGAGTTFRVTFPAGTAHQVSAAPTQTKSELWGSETILVVDDDDGIRRMTRVALERLGYKVLLAQHGGEAVEIFEANQAEIAVVLLDWAMPVMNGEEALMRILETDPKARVIMSSGYAETETLQRLGTPLLAGFVQKPYTTAFLAQKIREVLGERVTAYNRSSAEIRAGA